MPLILPIWRQSLCAVSGAIAGGLAGTVMGLAQAESPHQNLTVPEAWEIALVLGAAGWLVLLILVGLWFHYGLAKIALPALVNAMLTSIVTVFVCRALHIAYLDTLLGVLIGTLIGYLLCRLCGRYFQTSEAL
jgi:hypothetical protein